jgi:hypothetical protein
MRKERGIHNGQLERVGMLKQVLIRLTLIHTNVTIPSN